MRGPRDEARHQVSHQQEGERDGPGQYYPGDQKAGGSRAVGQEVEEGGQQRGQVDNHLADLHIIWQIIR